jgi:hypothetical protein
LLTRCKRAACGCARPGAVRRRGKAGESELLQGNRGGASGWVRPDAGRAEKTLISAITGITISSMPISDLLRRVTRGFCAARAA